MEEVVKEFHLDLNNISKFNHAEFERKIYREHLRNLIKSIKENGLWDKNIYVWEENGKFKIIDGQHRIKALESLLLDGFKKSFPIFLHQIRATTRDDAAKIFLEKNLIVKSLTGKDILKVFDDGSLLFFNNLSKFCNHYGTKKSLAYVDIIQAMKYAKTGTPSSIRKTEIEEFVRQLKNYEIVRVNSFLQSVFSVLGKGLHSFIFRAVILRNLLRTYWEIFPKLNQRQWNRFIKKCSSSAFLKNNSTERSWEGFQTIYNYLDELYKKA